MELKIGQSSENLKISSAYEKEVGGRGYSAYEIALQHGYVGTEEQWLNSLVGAQGPAGAQGVPGNGISEISKVSTTGLVDTYIITFDDGTTETYTITNGKDGVDGEKGEDAKINGVNTLNIQAGENINISQSGSTMTISSGGANYTAGTGIEITEQNVINNTAPNRIISITADPQTMELDKTAGEINSLIEQGYLILLMGRLMFIDEYDSSRNKLYAYFYSGGYATKFTITGNQVTDYESLDVVYDNHYTHTDNNFTNADKNKLDNAPEVVDLSSYSVGDTITDVAIVAKIKDSRTVIYYNGIYYRLAAIYGTGYVFTTMSGTDHGQWITLNYRNDYDDFYFYENNFAYWELPANKVTSLSSSSTDTQYPSAKAVYDTFVKPTDYATASTGGVFKIGNSYGTTIYNGFLSGVGRTYANYSSDSNALIICKGTLENVITGKELVNKSQLEARVEKAEMVYNAIPKVTGTGTDLTLEDTAEAPMEIEVGSNTYQLSTTGKNLADFPTNATLPLANGSTTIIDFGEDKTFSNLTLSFIFDNAKFTSSSTAALCNFKMNDDTNQYRLASSYNMSINTTLNGTYSKSESNITFRYLIVYLGSNYSGFTQGKCSIQLEKSTTATSYEPYTGASPSPSPSYPQTIQVVKGNNSIKVGNKNLFDGEIELGNISADTGELSISSTRTRSTNFIKVEPNTTYTFTRKAGQIRWIIGYTANKEGITDGNFQSHPASITTLDNGVMSKNFTTTATTEYIKWYDTSNTDLTEKVQIEKGSTATTYEPHKERVFPLTLGDIEYCKIGDYKDRIFKNVVGDVDYDSSKELGKWYLKKNIGKVVLDGSEDWVYPTQVGTSSYYRFENQDFRTNNCLVHSVYISDKFKYGNWDIGYNVVSNTTGANTNRLWITIDTTLMSGTTANDFATWLSTHNTTVYYVLATPTYTLLNDTLQTQLDNISNAIGYQEQTNISQTNADLPAIINASAVMDLNSLVTRVAILEA